MDLLQQCNLSEDLSFKKRAESASIATSVAVSTEVLVDQQTISMGAVTAGTFTITFLGQTTPAQQWNSTAVALQAALNALTTIGAGGVECTGGPLPGTPVVVNFIGGNLTGAQTPMTHADTLTGGVATIAHTTTGTWILSHTKRAALSSKIVATPTGYRDTIAKGLASQASVQNDFDPVTLTPLSGVVSNATNANPIVITDTAHGLTTGQTVTITGVVGNTAANGTFVVTVLTANTFSIPVTGNGAYTSGGTWLIPESTIKTDMGNAMSAIYNTYI